MALIGGELVLALSEKSTFDEVTRARFPPALKPESAILLVSNLSGWLRTPEKSWN